MCPIAGIANLVVPPASLHLTSAVGEPFEWVIVDSVGPLPRSKSGNMFLLTIMFSTTRFPGLYHCVKSLLL